VPEIVCVLPLPLNVTVPEFAVKEPLFAQFELTPIEKLLAEVSSVVPVPIVSVAAVIAPPSVFGAPAVDGQLVVSVRGYGLVRACIFDKARRPVGVRGVICGQSVRAEDL